MNMNTAGSLSDVLETQRAARARISPWWLRILGSAAFVAVLALFLGTEQTAATPWALTAAIMVIAAVWEFIEHGRGVSTDRGMARSGPLPARVIASYVATFAILGMSVFVSGVLRVSWLPHGGFQGYALVFVFLFVLWMAFLLVTEKIEAFRLSQVGIKSAARFDDLIATRTNLVLVAALALVKSIRLERLAKTLRMSASELTPVISDLADAQYVEVRGDAADPLRQ